MPETVSMTLFWITTGVLFIWLLMLSLFVLRQQQFFAHFTQGVTKKDLKSSLQAISQTLKRNSEDIGDLYKNLTAIQKDGELHFQKQGFVRFNPYADTGGNQSFCLCLLNSHNDGIVITSLHSREQTRIYAKLVKSGISENAQFSKEEKDAVAMAVKAK